jgi:phosphate uptake regulator
MAEKDLGYRRVQSTGRGSFIISLPKEWVQDTGLKRGNEIAFSVLSDSSLVLVPRKLRETGVGLEEEQLKEYCVNVDPKEDSVSTLRKIRALYAIGADIIHLRFKNADDAEKYKTGIKNFVRDTFLGSEIIDETPVEVTLQILIRHSEFSIEKAVRRMAIVALSANKDAFAALKTRNGALFDGVVNSYNDVNRLGLYIVRQLKYGIERNLYRELGFRTSKEFLLYRIAVNDVENIGKDAMNIIKNLATFQKMLDEETLFVRDPIDEEIHAQLSHFNSLAHQVFEDATKAMFKRDYQDAEKIISRRENYAPLENELIMLMSVKKLDPNVASVLRLIFDSSRRIMDYGRNMAELTLNRTVEENCSALSLR